MQTRTTTAFQPYQMSFRHLISNTCFRKLSLNPATAKDFQMMSPGHLSLGNSTKIKCHRDTSSGSFPALSISNDTSANWSGLLERVPGRHPGAEVRPGLCTHGRQWVHISPLHREQTHPNQVDRGRVQDTGERRRDEGRDSSLCGNDCTHFKTFGGRQTIVSEGG